jgi:predicted amidohydrolase YtcJ
MRLTRRTFLMTSTAILVAGTARAQSAETADTIYSGGPILTMTDAAPRADAVAVKDGRILAVGALADVMKLKTDKTRMVDLKGATLLPGFVDPHGHMTGGGLQAMSANLLAPPDGKVTDIAGLQATLKEWAEANKEIVQKAKIIIGFGYDQSQLKELRAPTKEELDAVSTDVPVLCVQQSGHMGALNSKALALVGITADTPNPPGGTIDRKSGSQEPSGVLEEEAWFKAIPKLLGSVGPAGMKALAQSGSELWASFGYTTAQEGRSSKTIDAVLKEVTSEGKIKIDVVSYPDFTTDRTYIKDNASRTYDKRFRVGGIKLTIDGSPQAFTAWRDRPYYAPVGNFPAGYVGYPAVTNAQIFEAVEWAYANDVQILTHSNGEAATDQLIAAATQSEQKHGKADRRPVLMHGQFIREDQIADVLQLYMFPSLFPMHTFYWGDWHREHTVGPALVDDISPTGWVVERGGKFTTHSDAPVAFPDTMRILSATVTRRSRSGDIIGPTQRVDVATALKAMTIWAAYEIFEDDQKGSLEVGKLADFVILSGDPTAVDPETLDELKVMETIKEDESIFVHGQKKADLLRPRDITNPGMHEMFHQLYVMQKMDNLPPSYQTAEARTAIESGYDHCGATLLLPWLFGVEEESEAVAAN